ncbi:hypothetical protein G6F66_014631 [Rhizopus arrhizus]|nr:hypothetical protein G6F66_014631 [Rhizopus arrhizus]
MMEGELTLHSTLGEGTRPGGRAGAGRIAAGRAAPGARAGDRGSPDQPGDDGLAVAAAGRAARDGRRWPAGAGSAGRGEFRPGDHRLPHAGTGRVRLHPPAARTRRPHRPAAADRAGVDRQRAGRRCAPLPRGRHG